MTALLRAPERQRLSFGVDGNHVGRDFNLAGSDTGRRFAGLRAHGISRVCASATRSEREDMLDRPIDCATADVDVAVLKEAIPGATERIASRVRLVIPVSRIAGRVTGDLDARREIASGRTEQDLRARIAEIQAACSGDRPAKN